MFFRRPNLCLTLALGVACLIGVPSTAKASVTLDLTIGTAGPNPLYSPYGATTVGYIDASFSQKATNTVELTLTSHLMGSEYVLGGYGGPAPPTISNGLFFNVGAAITSLNGTFVSIGGVAPTGSGGTVTFSRNGVIGDGAGAFDVGVSFNANALQAGTTAVIDFTATGLTVGSFEHVSAGGLTLNLAAAYIQGITPPQGQTKTADLLVAPTPEPATILMAASVLIPVGLQTLRRVRRSSKAISA